MARIFEHHVTMIIRIALRIRLRQFRDCLVRYDIFKHDNAGLCERLQMRSTTTSGGGTLPVDVIRGVSGVALMLRDCSCELVAPKRLTSDTRVTHPTILGA